MMRDDEDDEEEFARPPAPHEQQFNTKIEAALGYDITDAMLRDEIAEDVYNPKPKAEFGFDPTVEGAGDADAPLVKLADYAANTGNLQETEDAGPTNLTAATMGYVMPTQMEDTNDKDVEKEVGEKFGGRTPQDGDSDGEDGTHTPYQQLDTVDEASEDSYNPEPDKKPAKPAKKPRASDIGGGLKDRITVAVRFRPMTKEEMVSKSKKKKEGGAEAFMAWTVEDDDETDVIYQKGSRSRVEGKNMFHVDRVFEEQDTTDALYSNMCTPIMSAVLNGQHGTIFGYGQTGGGKSYTMQGGKKGNGVIHLAAKDLFERISEDSEREYTVKACYFEIYNEQVRDLMGHEESDDVKCRRGTAVIMTVNKLNVDLPVLNIREDSKGGDVFVDAQYTPVSNVAGVTRVLHKGNRNRATEKTDSNEFSSRSHAIFRLTVESHERVEGDADVVESVKVRVAALNFVDLAGSENAAKANTSGARKREGGKINQSLLSLTQVIHQLSLPKKKQPKHINYRDSKLTRILQPHLSGNAAISILCCASPAKKLLEETRSTLKFAYNAKRIKLQPKVNEIVDDRVLLENLRKELHETRLRLKEMKEIQERAPPPPPPSSSGPEFPLIERFMAQMNMSVATADFMDAIEELSSPDSGGLAEVDSGGLAAPSGDTEGGNLNAAAAADSPAAAGGEAETEDEDDIEAFRRQILAKFMNMEDDEFDGDDNDDGDNAETVNDTTMNDTTMGDTTMGDTTMGDTTMDEGATTDVSMNRTFATEDTNADQADNKENQPVPDSPPEIARKEPPALVKEAHAATNANEVFRKPDAQPTGPPGMKQPEPSPLPLVSQAINVPPSQMPVQTATEDTSSRETPAAAPPDEADLNLIEKFRQEILEKFRDEIVDEEAAHELDENAQNVAVIANELINKFKREIVYKYKDEFPEILEKRVEVDLAATRVGDHGIVGRVIERGAVGVDSSDDRLNTDDSSDASGSVERFEDEFDEDAKLGGDDDAATADPPDPRGRGVPARSYSTQTDRAVINGRGLFKGIAPSRSETDPSTIPINSSVGIGATGGSVSSDLSSDVAEKDKEGSGISPVPANPPSDDGDDYMIPLGEIAVKSGEVSVEGKMRIKFLEEKLVATDELVETLFVELENAKTFIRELVFENAGGGKSDPSGAALFGPAGTSGVTVVDEQILNQCEILKFAIYTSLLFFVFGQHELFLATVFFLWLSLEVATKT
ncbi:Kinesin-like protein [Seminavis robusta]|uniref:Kinesin-like protein n=1 Tax=Seminavis robusta TaxID=568900 RepID=A0A9N8DCJ3_9STRA|nr:Kinesin-like protein [Seminavis robusta]|eukprot:Sro84_g045010.1 Kinesin-like protein (1221) ;mRNA; f:101059-104876